MQELRDTSELADTLEVGIYSVYPRIHAAGTLIKIELVWHIHAARTLIKIEFVCTYYVPYQMGTCHHISQYLSPLMGVVSLSNIYHIHIISIMYSCHLLKCINMHSELRWLKSEGSVFRIHGIAAAITEIRTFFTQLRK